MIMSSLSASCRIFTLASGLPSTRRMSARKPGLIWPSSSQIIMMPPRSRVEAKSALFVEEVELPRVEGEGDGAVDLDGHLSRHRRLDQLLVDLQRNDLLDTVILHRIDVAF